MKFIHFLFGLLLLVSLPILAQAQGLAIVVNSDGDTAVVFDPYKKEIVAKLPTKLQPQDVKVAPNGKVAYILEMGSGTKPGKSVAIYDLETYTLKSVIDLKDYNRPHWSEVSKDGKILWAACAGQNAIVEINLESQSIIKAWDTKQPGSYNFTVSRDGNKIYSANFDTTTITIINRKSGQQKIVPIGGKPIGIDASPDGKEIWISSNATNEITVVDAKTDNILRKFSTTGQTPCRLKFTHDGKFVLVTQAESKELTVFNALTKELAWKVKLDGNFPKSLAVSPDDKQALVSFGGGNGVAIIDLQNKKVISQLHTGKGPEGVSYISK